MKYYSLAELIGMIDDPIGHRCFNFYREYADLFETSKGSERKHQWWEGGYQDHIVEVMNIAVVLYDSLDKLRNLTFSLSDALLTLFLHDVEKLWTHAKMGDRKHFTSSEEKASYVEGLLTGLGFELNKEQWNALKYVHGEGKDYHPEQRVQGPLAAFIHACDTVSARIWFGYPLDPGVYKKW